MRDLGNTLIVVGYDEEMMRSADFFCWYWTRHRNKWWWDSSSWNTSRSFKNQKVLQERIYGKRKIEVPKTRRKGNSKFIEVTCKENNLKNIDVSFPENLLQLSKRFRKINTIMRFYIKQLLQTSSKDLPESTKR